MSRGADPTMRDENNQTALALAAIKGLENLLTSMLFWFIRKGPSSVSTDVFAEVTLQAAMAGQSSCLELCCGEFYS